MQAKGTGGGREGGEQGEGSGSGGKEEGLVCDKGLCASWGAFSDADGCLRDVRQRVMSYICQ